MLKSIVCTGLSELFITPNISINCHLIRNESIHHEIEISNTKCASKGNAFGFIFCTIFQFPSAISLKKHCPNLAILKIEKCKLSKITADDLEGFGCLTDLYIDHCEIDFLPGDLFKFTPNLKVITFTNNKIKNIGAGILKPLRSVNHFNLTGNIGINYVFDAFSKTGSIKELQDKINEIDGEKKLKEMQEEINILKAVCEIYERRFENLYVQVQEMDEDARNFTIKIAAKDFKVHKRVLKAHSKTMAEFLDKNPATESFTLSDISEAIFIELLNFMYTENPPKGDVNIIELLAASCQLKMEILSKIAAKILLTKVTPENALDILLLCNKYSSHEQLKQKAFEEFKKNFPLQILMPELASQPEKLEILMKGKREMDALVAEVHATANIQEEKHVIIQKFPSVNHPLAPTTSEE